ncbi:MAG: hypothetical protein JSW28_07710 [Thermoplasmata archaeon]|nr:MAG: hypothetical protein JSW28_07710 [Thermoplasmata archaeon]
MSANTPKKKAKVYRRYPKSSLLIYNGATAAHFILGGVGIILGYGFSTLAILFGIVYLAFAFGEMYLIMPFKVCPNCPYYRMKDSLCVSGMNIVSRRLTGPGNPKDFPKRAEGLLCPNNLYMASLMVPIIAMIPALLFYFSVLLLVIFIAVILLLLFRFFVIFMKVACIHCAAKYTCPQAGQMGVREM